MMALNGVKHVKKLLKKHRIFVKIEIYKTMNVALNNGKQKINTLFLKVKTAKKKPSISSEYHISEYHVKEF